ncbi:MAG: 2'-5' RNA ligase family protein [FCB group bacterium]|nr:2'-5' RNA ligase family protein [FCB group bacterium]
MSLLIISYPDLAGDDFDWIQSLRLAYCQSEFKIVDPHFTLVFAVSEYSQTILDDHIRPIINDTAPINFVLRCATTVKTKADDRWFLFLVPDEGFSQIVKLHDNLYTGIMGKHLRLDIPFTPHMTIGIFDDARACKAAADRINSENFAIHGRISAFDLVTDDDDVIKTRAKFRLDRPATI